MVSAVRGLGLSQSFFFHRRMEAAAGKMRYSRHSNPGRILAAPAATLRFLFPVFVAVSAGRVPTQSVPAQSLGICLGGVGA